MSFQQRIGALARAHGVLTSALWKSASLQSIVDAALVPFATEERIIVRAPSAPIEIAPNVAVTISLMLHELATNASKYGALSNTAGRIEIDVGVRISPGAGRTIYLSSREIGGLSVIRPTRHGFGSRLIRASAEQLGSEVKHDYAVDGVSFSISLPERASPLALRSFQ